MSRRAGRSPLPWHFLALALFCVMAFWPLAPVLNTLISPASWGAVFEPRLTSLFTRTLWMSACSGLLAILCGWPMAILATRTNAFGSAFFAFLIPFPLLLPPLLLAQAWHGITGMDGPWASVWTLGLAYAPLPALFATRALQKQQASAHETALLSGGPRFALAEMCRISYSAAILGAILAAILASTDFAVPDYFASLGDKFAVYAAEIFNHWRSYKGDPATLEKGAAVASPLLFVSAIALWGAFALRDRNRQLESESSRQASPLQLKRWTWLGSLTLFSLALLLFLFPLGRIFFETGASGPLADSTWLARSISAFQDAISRGRSDLGRSLGMGALAATFVFLLAPILTHFWLSLHRSPRRMVRMASRIFGVALALPLLSPAVGTGIGAILAFNRAGWEPFYDSLLFPAIILAGRFMPIAVFLLAERMIRAPRTRRESSTLLKLPFHHRLLHTHLGSCRDAWFLSAGLVAVFSIRELDLAVLLPAANASAAVRYYNALHFARDNFVAAFGLIMTCLLLLPLAIHALRRSKES